jgi:L-serine dehydratase
MRAARRFVEELAANDMLKETDSVTVDLYGSLAHTGEGHGTDRAILLGLMGELPEEVDPATIGAKIAKINAERCLPLLGQHTIGFDPNHDISFRRSEVLPGHPNGMRFFADDWGKRTLASKIFYSIGGGFIATKDELQNHRLQSLHDLPYRFTSAAELLSLCRQHQKPIWALVLENEKALRDEEEVRRGVFSIWQAMKDCTDRGLQTQGTLPGRLQVRRRAPNLYRALCDQNSADPLVIVDWLNLFAIAVNEENAAGGRVVTAPTNGAAGVIPAVVRYYQTFVDGANDEGIFRFFLTATAIGLLYKENASISGAEVGCQGEIGVACSMAAGGLVAALRGTNEQIEHAAEIAMEHTLGMTCDPVAGLVQIPCIERNAFGAVKAVNAARLSMNETGDHKVSLDQVIRTMLQTGRDMQMRYKETSLAGLAVNVVEC